MRHRNCICHSSIQSGNSALLSTLIHKYDNRKTAFSKNRHVICLCLLPRIFLGLPFEFKKILASIDMAYAQRVLYDRIKCPKLVRKVGYCLYYIDRQGVCMNCYLNLSIFASFVSAYVRSNSFDQFLYLFLILLYGTLCQCCPRARNTK